MEWKSVTNGMEDVIVKRKAYSNVAVYDVPVFGVGSTINNSELLEAGVIGDKTKENSKSKRTLCNVSRNFDFI